MNDDGWQTVRYGRRRQRIRLEFGDGYQGSGWGMDRAYTSSFGMGYYRQSPNQPVPSSRTSGYSVPQTQQFRSYADVVSPRYQQPARRWDSPRPRDPELRREAAEPSFGQLIRKTYGVIKLLHHLQNVSTKPETQQPAMITKMVGILTDMIKPAYPTQRTKDLVVGNAKNWGYTTCQILMEHYETQLENFMRDLSDMDTREWRSAFSVAVRWAKRNLRRIKQTTLDHAEAYITAVLDQDEGQHIPPRSDSPISQNHGTATEDLARDQDLQRTEIIVQPQRERRPHSKVTVATMTDQHESNRVKILSQSKSLQEKRGLRGDDRGNKKDVSFVEESPSCASNGGRVQEDLPSLNDWFQPGFDFSPERRQVAEELDYLEAHPKRTPNIQSKMVGVQAHREMDEEIEDYRGGSEDERPEQTEDVEPDQVSGEVHRHRKTNRKNRDWHLHVKERWLIIGDSNLSNIPRHSLKDLQIESFPGATFRNAENIVKKSTTDQGVDVELVLLAFGICDRKNKPKETILKSCMAAHKACRDKFPCAYICVPQVNFSATLSEEERENLETFNDLLLEHDCCFRLLPEDKFQTVDSVHWTRDTGRAMLNHWTDLMGLHKPYV